MLLLVAVSLTACMTLVSFNWAVVIFFPLWSAIGGVHAPKSAALETPSNNLRLEIVNRINVSLSS
jgi:hypothetical protein